VFAHLDKLPWDALYTVDEGKARSYDSGSLFCVVFETKAHLLTFISIVEKVANAIWRTPIASDQQSVFQACRKFENKQGLIMSARQMSPGWNRGMRMPSGIACQFRSMNLKGRENAVPPVA
jgi:hypothetical protein